MKRAFLCLSLCGLTVVAQEQSLDEMQMRLKPTEPADAIKTFQVQKGFYLELVAAEPLVADPVAAAFDEDGRLYVCEMGDYPYPPKAGELPSGRVRLLEDRDGDGVYETSKIFVDHLPWPAGVVCWRGGVFVASAPDIWYFKDAGGGKVEREKIFTGFGTGESYAIVNSLQWGLDNKIYGASSYNHGTVGGVRLGSRDFRFDPVTRKFEAISGNAEFGNSFDDWGNRFVCNATNLIFHPVLPDDYLARNPNLAAPRVMDSICKLRDFGKIFPISPPEPWKAAREKFWSKFLNTRRDLNAGRFPKAELAPHGYVTSAAGVTIYRGAAYPAEYRGNAFTGEVANNLVVRLALQPNGVSFTADRVVAAGADRGREFLASTDNWFRPANFVNAPDGCLWMLDMYREVIEDASAIPDEILKHLDLTSGRDRGRIYRIAPNDFRYPKLPRLSKASVKQLVATLENPNGWTRDTAQRLLVERADKKSIEPLRELVRASKLSQAKVHALWTLHALDALDQPTLLAALRDADAHVREHALRAGENQLTDKINLLALADDPEPRVRFQTALSLSAVKSDAAVAALAKIAQRDANDPWIRTAVLCAAAGREGALLAETSDEKLLADLAALVGASKDEKQITAALDAAKGERRQLVIRGIAEGLARAGSSTDSFAAAFAPLFEQSRRVALDSTRAEGDRVEEIKMLGYAPFAVAAPALRELIAANQSPAIQLAAVQAFASQKNADVAKSLLDSWRSYSPQLRREVAEAIFRDAARLPALLDALEQKQITPSEFDPARQQALLKHRDKTIRQRAAKIFGEQTSSRAEVIVKYQDALKLDGDAARGAEIFQKTCATCHRVASGKTVGPDLASVKNHSAEQILIDILDPNRAVQPNYLNYTLLTTDGEELTGIIAEETATSVTLRRAEGAEDVVLRNRIKSLTASRLSLMPEDLEASFNPQQLADLIRFLQEK